MRTTDGVKPTRRTAVAPARFNSLVAAAEVMRSPRVELRRALGFKMAEWMTEAWSFYDTVGELGFGALWVGNGLSRVNLVAARPPSASGDEPTPIDPDEVDENGVLVATPAELRAVELVRMIAGGASGQGQMLNSFGIHLTIAGIAWLVAEPDVNNPEDDVYRTWEVYSASELRMRPGAKPEDDDAYEVAVSDSEWRPLHRNALVTKIWRRHPNRRWLPESPTRRCLGVLREIDGYQKHKHATILSRLAGAGLLILPTEVVFPQRRKQTADPVVDVEADDAAEPTEATLDDFVETFVEHMVTPIADRSSPSAITPLVIQVPGEYVDKVRHLSFSMPFDERVAGLLDQAVKRLALGLDMPPEVLLGVADLNHWNVWRVDEVAITLHIEPNAETVCHGLTIGYLDPALTAEGLPTDGVMVWYDTTDLTVRPDKSAQASEAHERGELSSAAYLRELGFREDDAPSPEERDRWLLTRLISAPTPELTGLILPLLLKVLRVEGLSAATPTETAPAPSETSETPGPPGPPEGPPPSAEMTAALVAACDGIVDRALERAGAKLRSAAGRRTPGGASSIRCDDLTTMHVTLDATSHESLDRLLEGAWSRVPAVAARYQVPAEWLTANLDAYVRSLMASRNRHTIDRLSRALGVE